MSMKNEDEQYLVLFVDDEELARKYFARALAPEMKVITAASVSEAQHILEREGERIAVLVTDQRMPGQTGVELLKETRANRPDIVRLLTTAYSDLGDAIEAVNRGEVFRYLTKPWDIPALRAEMRQAMDYYRLREERDHLLQEKLSVRQRMIQVDRIRDLIMMAGSFRRLRYSVPAIASYLRYAVASASSWPDDAMSPDLWSLVRTEVERSLALISDVGGIVTVSDPATPFPDSIPPAELLRTVEAETERKMDYSGAGNVPEIRGNAVLLSRLLAGLVVSLGGEEPLKVELRLAEKNGDAAHLIINFVGDSAENVDAFAPQLIAAFLLAIHHGGSLDVSPDNATARLALPLDPGVVPAPELADSWLEDILSGLEDD